LLTRRIYRSVQTYVTAVAVIITVVLLVFTIYFTELNMQWATFLTGILIASVLSMTSRASRSEWIITRRTLQLASMKSRLEQETQLREIAVAEHQQSLTLLQQTKLAYGRLIPRQLLTLLEKDSIVDVNLGDQIERKVTIMFSDIRNFTPLSESMSPRDNFNFLNSYLSQMEPVISKHGGIIDKYMGDGIMALFLQGADDAVSGAVAMIEKLNQYNEGRKRAGYAPIQAGFGLNTGLVIIGTVGGANRMDSTVIGDAVNLASRIEEATKTYHAPLLISQNTLYDIHQTAKYDIRFLDRIRVKGKTQPMSIYEVFDNDPYKLRDAKRNTKSRFGEAIAYYHLKEIPRAMKLFAHCIEIAPDDVPARIYLSRCEEYQSTQVHYSTGELNNRFEWHRDFNVGIEEIDALHKHLLAKVNELIATDGNVDSNIINEIYNFLRNQYMEGKVEEKLMHRYNYSFIDSHLQEHQRLIENFTALKEDADAGVSGPLYLSFRTQLLLFDWFTGHIAKADRHMARFIIAESFTKPKNGQ
jgi:adenylate cyclase